MVIKYIIAFVKTKAIFMGYRDNLVVALIWIQEGVGSNPTAPILKECIIWAWLIQGKMFIINLGIKENVNSIWSAASVNIIVKLDIKNYVKIHVLMAIIKYFVI